MPPASALSTIEVLTGPYRSGKTVRLLNRLVDYLHENKPAQAVLIVPSHRYRKLVERRLVSVLADRKAGSQSKAAAGLFGLRIVSFYKLCEDILRRRQVPFRVIPDKVRASVLQRILAELDESEKLIELKPICQFAGTNSQVMDLIDEFERAALSPQDVIARLEERVKSGSKYMELAAVYERYWQALEELGYIDERMLAFKLREELAGTKEETLDLGFLGVDGFDRFNPLQLQILSALSTHCENMTILFDYLEPDVDRSGDYLWKESSFLDMQRIFSDRMHLVSSGNSAGAQPNTVPLPQPPPRVSGRRKNIDTGQLSLFSLLDSFSRPSEDGMPDVPRALLTKHKALDRYFEMDFIARTVKERIVRSGVLPESSLVVVRDLRDYRAAATAAFENAGVPFYLDEAVPLTSVPLVKWIMLALTLSRDKLKRTMLIRFLRSMHFNRRKFNLSSQEINRIDEASVKKVVLEGRDQWLDCVSDSPLLTEKLQKLIDRLTPPRESLSFESWARWVDDLIEQILYLPDEESERDPHARAEKDNCFAGLSRALATLIQESSILGSRLVPYDQFMRRLQLLIEQSNFRRLRRAEGAVTICSAELAPNSLFDDIYIVGLVEGEFPRRVSRSGFTSPEETERWAGFGIDIYNPRHHPAFESALYNSLIQRARQRIVVTCSASEMDGEELIPSFLLTAGKSEELAMIVDEKPFAGSLAAPVSARDLVAGVLWHDTPHLKCSHPDVVDWKDSIAEPLSIVFARDAANLSSVWNGYLSDLVLTGSAKVELPRSWSATRLGEYGKCPFRYWVNYGLGIRPHEEPEIGLTVRDLGTCYHKALELFYRELHVRERTLLTIEPDEREAIMKQSLAKAFEHLERQATVRKDDFWQYALNEIEFRMRRFIAYETDRAAKDKHGFVPSFFEEKFGLEDADSKLPLIVSAGGNEIRIGGQIDRIDLSVSDGVIRDVRVVDYKTGSTQISEIDARQGRDLQLSIYAMAVAQRIVPGSRVSDGVFLSVSQGIPIGNIDFLRRKPGDERPDIVEVSKEHIASYVSQIGRGNFGIKPNGEKVCEKCPHQMVCRIKELRSAISDDGGGR